MAGRPKLKQGDISLNEVLELSKYVYKKKRGSGGADNKLRRMKMDIVSGKIKARKGLSYNRSTKEWEQTTREVRIDFTIKSKPKSYKDTSGIDTHTYPVIFVIKDWDKGLDSSFRFRSGGLRKWKTNKQKISEGKNEAEKDRIRKANKKTQQSNIINGLDGSFIFELMWVCWKFGLLFGPMTALNKPPDKTNPDYIPYFDKHSLYIVLEILPRLFVDPKLKRFKKTDKVDSEDTADAPPETKETVEISDTVEYDIDDLIG